MVLYMLYTRIAFARNSYYITLFRVKINKTKKDDNYGRSQTNTARDSRALNPVFDASTRDASTRAASRRDHS